MINNFTSISNKLIKDNRLTTTERMIFIVLSTFAYGDKRECYPSRETIAKEVSRCLRTVSRCIKKLEELGYITIKRNTGYVNTYIINAKVIINSAVTKVKDTINTVRENTKNKFGKDFKESFNRNFGQSFNVNFGQSFGNAGKSVKKNNKKAVSNFNNFQQREYNMEELEKQLLGWT